MRCIHCGVKNNSTIPFKCKSCSKMNEEEKQVVEEKEPEIGNVFDELDMESYMEEDYE